MSDQPPDTPREPPRWRRSLASAALAATVAFLVGHYLSRSPKSVDLSVCLSEPVPRGDSLSLSILSGANLVRKVTFYYKGSIPPPCQPWRVELSEGSYSLEVRLHRKESPLIWHRTLDIIGPGLMKVYLSSSSPSG